ncbi:MAG: MFS transporter, partial [Micromonosporaceae bacterium]
ATAARTQSASDRPATYREVFGVGEYRAVFTASVLSWIGDYFAKVAIAYLIFSDTGSVLYSAAAFAISYLPWVAGGPVLAALAERYPYRRVMILCDLVRMSLVALLAIPGTPLPALLALLFIASMLTPPAQSARSALIPRLLKGDRYVVGLSVQATAAQAAQVSGYAAGGVLSAAVNPRAALLVDATTFALSALVIWRGVKPRPAAMGPEHRSHLLRETAEGFRVVFGNPVMRPIAFVVFALVSVVIVPEGLAAGWSEDMGGGAWRAGLLMASLPLGYVAGAVVVGRIMAPSTRLKLIRPLALLTPLVLIPALADPPFPVVIAIAVAAGFANSAIMPLNGLFVQVLPNAYRARAFGIMQGGMQILHAVAVLVTGAIAEWFKVPIVVGAWSAVGLLLILLAVSAWPSPTVIDEQIAHAAVTNQRDVAHQSDSHPPEAGDAAEAAEAAPSPAATVSQPDHVDVDAGKGGNGKASATGPNHPHEGETVRL